jgi:hypothetical protein
MRLFVNIYTHTYIYIHTLCVLQNRTVKFKDEVEEFEPDPEADAEEAHQQELRQQRRAMLVQTLKNNKGRKRFMEWLYR